MPPVMVTLSPSPARVAEIVDELFDPMAFEAELIPDVDAVGGPNKCTCNAGDDQPY